MRVVPVPEMAPSVPPLTAISALVNVLPGSSLNVNVTFAVWPAFSAAVSLLIVTVGASVSTTMIAG